MKLDEPRTESTSLRRGFTLPRFELVDDQLCSIKDAKTTIELSPELRDDKQQSALMKVANVNPVVPTVEAVPPRHVPLRHVPLRHVPSAPVGNGRKHRDGVFGLAVGTGLVVALVALVVAMVTGVDEQWGRTQKTGQGGSLGSQGH